MKKLRKRGSINEERKKVKTQKRKKNYGKLMAEKIRGMVVVLKNDPASSWKIVLAFSACPKMELAVPKCIRTKGARQQMRRRIGEEEK